jgi:hypothetical protein
VKPPLRLLRGEPESVRVNKGLVGFLEEYLAKAKAGEILHGAFAYIHKDGHPGHFVAHPSVALLGSVADMQFSMMKARDKVDDE